MGIEHDDISAEKAAMLDFDHPYGAYVTKVLKNTAAEDAGTGDL